jgi:hypothetical protein
LPRSLRLTVTLQAALTVIAIIFAAPIVMQFASPYLSRIQVPSFGGIFLQVQTLWTTWLASLSQFHWPALPEIPVIELSTWYILLMVAVVSVLWLVGNRLLLRNQTKQFRLVIPSDLVETNGAQVRISALRDRLVAWLK